MWDRALMPLYKIFGEIYIDEIETKNIKIRKRGKRGGFGYSKEKKMFFANPAKTGSQYIGTIRI